MGFFNDMRKIVVGHRITSSRYGLDYSLSLGRVRILIRLSNFVSFEMHRDFMIIDTSEYAVLFAAMTRHTRMTGVLPVVGRALVYALLSGGSLGARALLSYEQVMRDRKLPLWD